MRFNFTHGVFPVVPTCLFRRFIDFNDVVIPWLFYPNAAWICGSAPSTAP
jgi:hypothetical protein